MLSAIEPTLVCLDIRNRFARHLGGIMRHEWSSVLLRHQETCIVRETWLIELVNGAKRRLLNTNVGLLETGSLDGQLLLHSVAQLLWPVGSVGQRLRIHTDGLTVKNILFFE